MPVLSHTAHHDRRRARPQRIFRRPEPAESEQTEIFLLRAPGSRLTVETVLSAKLQLRPLGVTSRNAAAVIRTTESTPTESAATKPAEAHVTRPTISRGTRLVSRRHIDLLRVSSAICRIFC